MKNNYSKNVNMLYVSLYVMLFVSLLSLLHAQSPRTKTCINTHWKFSLKDHQDSPWEVGYNDSNWDNVSVPHTLKVTSRTLDDCTDRNVQETFHRYVGWYRKGFTLDDSNRGKKIFIDFEGVMQTSEIWVNGEYVGKHEMCGYLPFFFEITDKVKFGSETNVLAIKVDNRRNAKTPPDDIIEWTQWKDGMDFVLFGGIYRDVYITTTSDIFIEKPWVDKQAGIRITTPQISQSQAQVEVDAVVKNDRNQSVQITVTNTVLDAKNTVVTSMNSNKTIAAGATALFTSRSSSIASPNLWSPESPYLYRVKTTVSEGSTVVDEMITRFGMRWFEFKTTSGFWLNGKQYKLVGINRHQTWPFVGNAVPNTVHYREAQQIKSIGVNWIRLSHYPHDPAFLDAMDELGILGVAEGPTWAHIGSEWGSNLGNSWRYLIRRDRNHPSALVWMACINHGGCKPWLEDLVHEEDPTRIAGHCDINCPMNFEHSQMVGGGGLCIEHTGHTYPTSRANDEARLIVHSLRHWEKVNKARSKPDNAGLAGWCMYDYNSFHNPTEKDNIVIHGIADLYRIPKFAYYWYQSELTTEPMVKIAHFWTANSPKDITIFSNCDQIELFVNGTSKGRFDPSTGSGKDYLLHPPFRFPGVAFVPGELKAVGYIGGNQVATDIVRTPESPEKILLKTDADTLLANGTDFARITACIVDANGTIVPDATNPVTFSISGRGVLIGDNPIPAVRGQIINLTQAQYSPGTITVTGSSGSLTNGSIDIQVVKDTLVQVNIINGFYQALNGNSHLPATRIFKIADNNFRLPHKISKTMKFIEIYDVRGRLLVKKPIKQLTSQKLSALHKSRGILIVRAVR